MMCHVFKKIVCIAVMVCASLAAHSAEQVNTDEVNGAPVPTVSSLVRQYAVRGLDRVVNSLLITKGQWLFVVQPRCVRIL
jgi:hypothetical protein